MKSQLDSSGPLHGYRVLDLTTFLSGPFCTQILGDLGADIVKVEAPWGDLSRAIPPHFVGQDSAYFLSVNRNKQSISLDVRKPEGIKLLKALIAQADVVVENYRPGVIKRMGLDIAEIRANDERLIWASISGFGQAGPQHDRPAYDMIVQALSGVMSLTGEPGRPAVRLGIPAGDLIAGMYCAIAINAALADRERSGKGRVIDIAMLDCQLAMLSYQSAYSLIAGVCPQPQAARHDSIPTYRSFVGRDGRELVVTANTQEMWQGLCHALGDEALLDDTRFTTGELRLQNKDALWERLEQDFRARDAADWIDPLTRQGVPVALIKTVPEALQDAKSAGRGMIQALHSKRGQSIEVVGNPINFTAGESNRKASYPPALGEDAKAVLERWLALPAHEIASLYESHILLQREESVAPHQAGSQN